MERLMIKGGRPLRGKVSISGAKNSAVALIPATLLAETSSILDNLPQIRDVQIYIDLLTDLGAVVTREGSSLYVDPSRVAQFPLVNDQVHQLRASYYLMGALLGRFGKAIVGLPGGCNLGSRPIDQHIKGFEALGAQVREEDGALHLFAPQLKGARIYLDVVSVGATINIMLAAVRAEGQTIIENAAKEPEIVDVATLLNSMGAQIMGAGTDVIRIRGVSQLRGCRHSIIPDRIEAGTYMIAAAATNGEVIVDNVIPKHLEPVTAKLREMGVYIEEADDSILVKGKDDLRPVNIRTLPYPGFPTDLQQPFTTLLTRVPGTSLVTDSIYSSRFKHVDELIRMGATIKVDVRTAIIEGGTKLKGTRVEASDLRAGAALVVGGLMAEEITEIHGLEHVDRGYELLEDKLKALGAEIWRV